MASAHAPIPGAGLPGAGRKMTARSRNRISERAGTVSRQGGAVRTEPLRQSRQDRALKTEPFGRRCEDRETPPPEGLSRGRAAGGQGATIDLTEWHTEEP
jgi:hypothetical protein